MPEVSSWSDGVGFMFMKVAFVSGNGITRDDRFMVVGICKLFAGYVPFRSISGKRDIELVV